MTELVAADAAGCGRAAALLLGGELVAFPTETVYGLGGDARNPETVAAIFAAKGRPGSNPLTATVPDLDSATALAEFDDGALALGRAFWPGPLTLVLPRRESGGVSPALSAGLSTLAVRIPAHPVALEILRRAAIPIALPSANPSGRISPTTAAHVLEGLGGRVSLIVDGGACPIGVESTVLDLCGAAPRILRPGGITASDIAAVLGRKVESRGEGGTGFHSPGELVGHYAPKHPLRLNASRARPGEALLGFGNVPGATLNLSPAGDLAEAAANLFAMLRALDAGESRGIAVSPIPETGLGIAINDRLARAAAPRGT